MDGRLFTIDGQRLSKLRREDLSLLARGIVGVSRGKGQLTAGHTRGVGYVRLKGTEFDIFVLKEDWEKVAPLVQEGALSTFEFPKYPAGVPLDGNLSRTLSEIDGPDRVYFLHVLAQLWVLFQDTWPT